MNQVTAYYYPVTMN